jgi:gliding motility-associated-like protein
MSLARLLIIGSFCTILLPSLHAQTPNPGACSVLGQTPGTAFPVCGTSVFHQDQVPTCDNGYIPVNCHDGTPYSDKNPFWYKFTCFQGGTLGFQITPNTLSDDYDWQLFDITGHDPSEVYSNPNLFVSGNWSSNPDSTGTSVNGGGSVNCAGPTYPNQNTMPTLIKGHVYLLMVSHFTDTQSGYSLHFGGGTASITDTTPPALLSAAAICDGTHILVVLNKSMQCKTLAADGSDFMLSPAVANTIAARSLNCSNGFDMDTLEVTLDGPLPLGTFSIVAKTGSDANTILDNCGTGIPPGDQVSFIVTPVTPIPMDSLILPGCATNQLQLVFKKKVECSSIDPAGGDFTVTGPSPVTISGASGACDANGESYVVLVNLSAPIVNGGAYQVNLRIGPDGNSLIDECGLQVIPGSLGFRIKDTVSAAYTDQVLYGCKNDTIVYIHPGGNGINSWQWVFDGKDTVRAQNPPQRIYSVFDDKSVQLIVSNGFCADTAQGTVALDNGFKASFVGETVLCPKDFGNFQNTSTGTISSWNWTFGDGTGSTLQTPPGHLFPVTGEEANYTVELIAGNPLGCFDTARLQVEVPKSCYITVPSAFTPNGDGVNDYLYPLNAYKAEDLVFKIYNRYGQLIFETHDWLQRWDGRLNGRPVAADIFVWTLKYKDHDSGKIFFQKGTTALIR